MLRQALEYVGLSLSFVPLAMLACVAYGWVFPSKTGVQVPNFPDPDGDDHTGPY